MDQGTVNILNCGSGDTRLTFDKTNPAESIRAGRIVRDMLRRGYALLVEVERNGEKKFERALEFNEKTCEYIIADFDPVQAHDTDMEDGAKALQQERGDYTGQLRTGVDDGPDGSIETERAEVPGKGTAKTGKGRGRGRRSVPASGTRAVAVARSAGG